MSKMLTALVSVLCLARPAWAAPFAWQTATPASQDMSAPKLDALRDDLAKRKTRAFLVVRNDQIIYEWYARGFSANSKQGTASLAKAVVGGLPLALALMDGRIRLDDPATKYIPEWKGDPTKATITVRQLGSHTSGLSDSTTSGVKNENQPGWKGTFWKRQPPPNDPFTLARDKAPVLFQPGRQFEYSNPGIGMLTYCVTVAIKDSKHRDIRSLLKDRIMRPIGVADAEWSVGYGQTFTVDGLPLVPSWGGASFAPRAMARIGRLVVREGDWDGRAILSRDALRGVTQDAGLPGHCGMGWWTNSTRRYDWLPRDAVWGAGAGDQVLLVIPSLKLIMVRNGEELVTPAELKKRKPKDVFERYHDPRAEILFKPLVEAITDRTSRAAPYPPSQAILRIDWAAKETIIRKAKGSDNWPLTWGDNDHQYTAYGDGNGFEPFVPKKLGLGIARVEGGPEDFKGVNIRAPSVENLHQGKDGKKASGILMVDGVLYLWTRNAGNSWLASSADHGKTWTWASWRFTTSFGCPTILNFGKNYAGARDEFVYVYSPDSDSAYRPADRMVLARVPKDKIRQREAYAFFTGLDRRQQPLWSKDIADRGAVFTHKGRCFRSGITFNAGLNRYLWVQIISGTQGKKADTRFEGGFAVYDAPEPWGPWTTAYFTEKWDVGPGESASFPTKWMSADGMTICMVFSGDDYFAVREAELRLAPPPDKKK